ncbi:MAG: FtsX-like permease family protein [Pseudomonadales bacterium]|nr:FtsX-like permease family protein [Pseudomonadales bacterium]
MIRRAVPLALRTLVREWHSGELSIVLLALTVAVAALTGVGFLVARIGAAVDLQANEVLAADLRLESPRPIAATYAEEARRRGLQVADSTGLLSVVFNGDESQLSNLRAVTPGYPLRGRVMVADVAFGAASVATDIPAPGEVWPESKLLASIGAQVGAELSIGAARFKVTRVLITRPDQGATFAELAPSILINAGDLPATELIQPGSRVSYAMLFAGSAPAVRDFSVWLTSNKTPSERLLDISESTPQIKTAIDRAGRFLSLASLVAVLLCAIAVAMAARRYVQRHLDSVALLKTLGATRAFTLTVSLLQLLLIGIVAAMIGAMIGFAAQAGLVVALKDLLKGELPPADWTPVWFGFSTSIAILAGFALPPLLQLSRTPALRVLRRDVGPPPLLIVLAFGPAVAAVVLLILWVVRDVPVFIWFTAGLGVFLGLLALAGLVLVRLTTSMRSGVGVAWRYGLANLGRRRVESVVQLTAFGCGLMVLLLLAVVRNDLLNDWRKSLPSDIPNYFFINIPSEERDEFVAFLRTQGAATSRVLPMIRARLTAINGKTVAGTPFANPRGQGFANREQNITWTRELGPDNRIVAGHWFTAAEVGQPLVSVSTEFQEALGLVIGDRLTFDVAGELFTARVSSVRKVKWDSFQPNFFLVFPPGPLDGTAGTWMTSAYFRPQSSSTLADLVRRFPSVSVFDLDDLLAQVRGVIDKAALAVQSVFLFTLLAGLVVLLAAVQASRDERRYESAILRTLGANRRTVLQGILAEFATLGVLSGLLAAVGASIAGYFLAKHVLDVPYAPEPWVWLIGIAGGGLLVSVAGWLATRSVVAHPPLVTLRGG